MHKLRYEDRWGDFRAVLYRLIIPVGLCSTIILLAPWIWSGTFAWLAAYPLIIVALVFCTVRGVVLARGPWKAVALAANLVLTLLAILLAFGIWLSTSGI